MNLLYKFLLSCAFIGLMSCGSEESNTIYSSPVHFTVDMNNLDNDLNAPMKAKAFTQKRLSRDYMGYGGLLVVCSANHIAGTIYHLYAYDLACTNERNVNVKVIPDNEGSAKCPKCGTVYDIFNGSGHVVSGPSKTSLQVYRNVRHENQKPGVFVIQR